jgi:hypothetical protein
MKHLSIIPPKLVQLVPENRCDGPWVNHFSVSSGHLPRVFGQNLSDRGVFVGGGGGVGDFSPFNLEFLKGHMFSSNHADDYLC